MDIGVVQQSRGWQLRHLWVPVGTGEQGQPEAALYWGAGPHAQGRAGPGPRGRLAEGGGWTGTCVSRAGVGKGRGAGPAEPGGGAERGHRTPPAACPGSTAGPRRSRQHSPQVPSGKGLQGQGLQQLRPSPRSQGHGGTQYLGAPAPGEAPVVANGRNPASPTALPWFNRDCKQPVGQTQSLSRRTSLFF